MDLTNTAGSRKLMTKIYMSKSSIIVYLKLKENLLRVQCDLHVVMCGKVCVQHSGLNQAKPPHTNNNKNKRSEQPFRNLLEKVRLKSSLSRLIFHRAFVSMLH